MRLKRLTNGTKAQIVYLVKDDGSCPAQEFIERLEKRWQKKVFHLCRLFCERGEIRNTTKLNKETANTYCMKANQVRISCFLLPKANPKTLVLSFGFKKKDNKMPAREKARAEDYYQRFTGDNT